MKRRKSGKKTKKEKGGDGGATTGDEKTDEEKETNEEPNTADSADEQPAVASADAPAEIPKSESTEKTTSDGEKDEADGELVTKVNKF